MEANAGLLFRYDEDSKEFFEKASSFKTDMNYINRFDRRNITKEMTKILDSIN